MFKEIEINIPNIFIFFLKETENKTNNPLFNKQWAYISKTTISYILSCKWTKLSSNF